MSLIHRCTKKPFECISLPHVVQVARCADVPSAIGCLFGFDRYAMIVLPNGSLLFFQVRRTTGLAGNRPIKMVSVLYGSNVQT